MRNIFKNTDDVKFIMKKMTHQIEIHTYLYLNKVYFEAFCTTLLYTSAYSK